MCLTLTPTKNHGSQGYSVIFQGNFPIFPIAGSPRIVFLRLAQLSIINGLIICVLAGHLQLISYCTSHWWYCRRLDPFNPLGTQRSSNRQPRLSHCLGWCGHCRAQNAFSFRLASTLKLKTLPHSRFSCRVVGESSLEIRRDSGCCSWSDELLPDYSLWAL